MVLWAWFTVLWARFLGLSVGDTCGDTFGDAFGAVWAARRAWSHAAQEMVLHPMEYRLLALPISTPTKRTGTWLNLACLACSEIVAKGIN